MRHHAPGHTGRAGDATDRGPLGHEGTVEIEQKGGAGHLFRIRLILPPTPPGSIACAGGGTTGDDECYRGSIPRDFDGSMEIAVT